MLLLIALILLGLWLILPTPYHSHIILRIATGILLIVAAVLELVDANLVVT